MIKSDLESNFNYDESAIKTFFGLTKTSLPTNLAIRITLICSKLVVNERPISLMILKFGIQLFKEGQIFKNKVSTFL